MKMAGHPRLVPPVQGLLLGILALHLCGQDPLATAEHNTVTNASVVASTSVVANASVVTNTSRVTNASVVTNTSMVTNASVVTSASVAANASMVINASVVTKAPVVTNASVAANTLVVTKIPVVTNNPVVTNAPVVTNTLVVTSASVAASTLAVTNIPVVTNASVVTNALVVANASVATNTLVVTNASVVTNTSVAANAPVVTNTPVVTNALVVTNAAVAANTSVLTTASVAASASVNGTAETPLTCQSFQCAGERCYQDRAHANETVTCQNETHCELYRFSSTNYTARCSSACGAEMCSANGTAQRCALDCCGSALCLRLNASAYGDLPPTTAPPTTTTAATTPRAPPRNGKVCAAFSCHGDGCFKGKKTVARCIVGQDFCEMKKTGLNYMAGCSRACKAAKPVCASGVKAACYQECCPATVKASCLKLDGKVHINGAGQAAPAPLVKLMAWGVVLLLHHGAWASLWG